MTKELPYKTIKEMEIYCINKALIKYSTKKEAAKMLGISERGLFNKMYNYKLK
jgi:transcriptional regulator with PAS, ATPase and Fis domain